MITEKNIHTVPVETLINIRRKALQHVNSDAYHKVTQCQMIAATDRRSKSGELAALSAKILLEMVNKEILRRSR